MLRVCENRKIFLILHRTLCRKLNVLTIYKHTFLRTWSMKYTCTCTSSTYIFLNVCTQIIKSTKQIIVSQILGFNTKWLKRVQKICIKNKKKTVGTSLFDHSLRRRHHQALLCTEIKRHHIEENVMGPPRRIYMKQGTFCTRGVRDKMINLRIYFKINVVWLNI